MHPRPLALILLAAAACGDAAITDAPLDAAVATPDGPPGTVPASTCREAIGAGVVGTDPVPHVFLLRGGDKTLLYPTAGTVRVVSPTADRIAIGAGRQLHIVTIATRAAQVIELPADVVALDWTGGDRVLVTGRTADGDRLDLVAPTGAVLALLAANGAPVTTARLASDGARAGFVRSGALYEVRTASSGAPIEVALPEPGAVREFAGWSARPGFVAYRQGNAIHIDGASGHVASFPLAGPTPQWAPTGTRLLLQLNHPLRGGNVQASLVVIDPSIGTQGTSLAQQVGTTTDRHPTWSRDGAEVAWTDDGSPTIVVASATVGADPGPPTIVTDWTGPAILLGACRD